MTFSRLMHNSEKSSSFWMDLITSSLQLSTLCLRGAFTTSPGLTWQIMPADPKAIGREAPSGLSRTG